MFNYQGSTALVTGASKGLGVAFAEQLAARGMNLVLVARSLDALQSLATRLSQQYQVQAIALAADLADADAADRIAAELERRGVHIDLLVNNAGLGLSGDFLSHGLQQEQGSIQVNVQALVALSHRFGQRMRARRAGGIINVASNASFQPLPAMATYAATKAFVLHFSEALGHELAGDGVQVMAACPGPTATEFFAGTSTQLSAGDLDSADSVVRRTLAAFDRRKRVAYPARLSVRLAMLLPRLLPRALMTRLAASATQKMGLH
jgi:short-subunit dehydrogenase